MNRRARKRMSDRLTRISTRLPSPPERPPEIHALIVRMIAYHLGAMQRRDTIVDAYARALGLASSSEFWQVWDAFGAGRVSDLQERYRAAVSELFGRRGISRSSTAEEFNAVLLALDDEVPEWVREQLLPGLGVRDFPQMFWKVGGTSSDRPDRTPTAQTEPVQPS